MTESLSIHLLNMPSVNDKAIWDIIDNIDWELCHKVMVYINWTWAGKNMGSMGVPTVDQLRESAYDLSQDVLVQMSRGVTHPYVSCGGITVRGILFPEGDIALNIAFELESWDNRL